MKPVSKKTHTPQASEGGQLVDKRDHGFYIVDDEIIEDYGPKIGPLGVAVYNVLVKHANKNNSCFPSYETIAKLLGITRNTAIKGVKLLLDHKLVGKRPRTGEYGAPASNDYKILPVKKHPKQAEKEPGEVVQNLHHPLHLSDSGSANSALGSANNEPPLVQDLHHPSANSAPEPDPSNQTQLNQTHTRAPAARGAPTAKACACSMQHGSRHCDDVRLAYGRNKPSINDAGSYAMSREVRAGRDDILIDEWIEQVENPGKPSGRDTRDCPDCFGNGHYFENPTDPKSMRRCKHPRLGNSQAA